MIQKVVNSFKIETNSENILVKIEEVTFNAENWKIYDLRGGRRVLALCDITWVDGPLADNNFYILMPPKRKAILFPEKTYLVFI